jgi:outer membrane protein OmpA-like peptidoglycan-associated protein
VSACGSQPSRNKVESRPPAARSTADPARTAPGQPVTVPAALREDVSPAGTPPGDAGKASRAVIETVVLGEGRGGFRLNGLTLSDAAKAKIDEMFADATRDLTTARFEIEGYTDNLGSKEVNERIGLARAIAVKQYLGEAHAIPGARIRVVSYGPESPIGDNTTQEGRSLNRRVVIKVIQ